MKLFAAIFLLLSAALTVSAQDRQVENKPYIDLRPLHFGILVGAHLQDLELENVGPQQVVAEDGSATEQTILTDVDNWNPGFSVGVVADLRLHKHVSLRFTPTMHFGAKHVVFRRLGEFDESGRERRYTQDLKSTYISLPIDLKLSAQRYGNCRPYVMLGINPLMNLTDKDQDYIRLKRYDTMIEAGLGCDFYLPFFKLIPELKFCYGLSNCLDTAHAGELQDAAMRPFAGAARSARSKMVVLTFYFE